MLNELIIIDCLNDFTHTKLMFIMELKVQFNNNLSLFIFYGQCYYKSLCWIKSINTLTILIKFLIEMFLFYILHYNYSIFLCFINIVCLRI